MKKLDKDAFEKVEVHKLILIYAKKFDVLYLGLFYFILQ